MTAAMHRTPCLETAQVKMLLNGPESFTPDGNFILGEAPELRPLLRRRRLQLRRHRQLGRRRPADRRMDRRRQPAERPRRTSTSAASARSWPTASCSPSAPARRSACTTRCAGRARSSRRRGRCAPRPLYDLLAARGAVFGAKNGWERANYFVRADAGKPPARPAPSSAHPRQAALAGRRDRRAAGDARGGRALRPDLVRQAAAAGSRRPRRAASACAPTRSTSRPGAWSTRALLNERGGFESDLTITRLGVDSFLVVTGSAQPTRDADWIAPAHRRERGGDARRRQRPDRGALGDGTERAGSCSAGSARPTPATRLAPERLRFSSTARDRRRLRPGARGAHELRRRAGLRALRADRDGAPRLPGAARRPAPTSASPTPATTRSTPCGSRPAGAPGARSSARTRRRSRPARCSR